MDILKVAVWLGIGDVYWALTKLRGLQKRYGAKEVEVHVNQSPSHKTVEYLKAVPFVTRAIQTPQAPMHLSQLPPSPNGWMHPKYSTIEGTKGWKGVHHILVPNGHLHRGLPLSSWLPEIEFEPIFDLQIDPEHQVVAENLAPMGSTLIYMSGTQPNKDFHNNTWKISDWIRVIELLNGAGVVPYMIGADTKWDHDYLGIFEKQAEGKIEFKKIVGMTSPTPIVMHLIKRAGVFVGLNSGLGITSTAMGTPTVMLWSDSKYPIKGAVQPLHTAMKYSWVPEERLPRYRALSYGSPELTPEAVFEAMMAVQE